MRRAALLLAAVAVSLSLTVAKTPKASSTGPASSSSSSGPTLTGALTATVSNGGPLKVSFTYTATNTGTADVTLDFSSGQRFDVVVSAGNGEVWRASEGMFYTQSFSSMVMAPGASLSYSATWSGAARGTSYTARGFLAPEGSAQATASTATTAFST